MAHQPQTLQDWILLMQAAKEKFGNLDVKLIWNDNSLEDGEFSSLYDIMIHGSTSLLKDDIASVNPQFVIVLE
jgi:hypothetical protein